MGQVYDMEKEIISEQSKKEICQAVKERAKDYLTEEQLAEMLTFANAAAAIVTTRKGAIRAMPEKEEVKDFIKKFKK